MPARPAKTPAVPRPRRPWPVLPEPLLVAVTAVLTAILLTMSTGGNPLVTAVEFVVAAIPVLCWLAAAAGTGVLVARPLLGPPPATRRGRGDRDALTVAIGAAVLLAVSGLVFRLDASRVTTWALFAPGLMVMRLRPWPRLRPTPGIHQDSYAQVMRILIGIPIGMLLVASLATPGLLWRSEFGGYDALSYHLPLPAAWAEAGVSSPIPTVAYGWMPNGFEHAFLHMGLLMGDVRQIGPAAQLLHASVAILGAWTTGRLAAAVAARAGAGPAARRRAAAIAPLLVLATPWVLVTGSLAYNEAVVLWFLAASLLAATRIGPSLSGVREGVLHGLLLATATAVKLTAAPLAAIPAIAWWFTVRRRRIGFRRLVAIGLGGAAIGAAVLAPWAVTNFRATGNPVFPFAPGVFGDGPWTAEQHEAWARGHQAGGDLTSIATRWLLQGIGGETPAQWGVLPLVGLAGTAALAALAGPRVLRGHAPRRTALAGAAAIAALLAGWLLLTHTQPRFLLPTAVPLAALAAAAMTRRPASVRAGRTSPVLTLPMLAGFLIVLVQIGWSLDTVRRERPLGPGRGFASVIGQRDLLRGWLHEFAIAGALERGDPDEAAGIRAIAPASWWVNHELPDDARILLVGESAVWHLDPSRIAWRTVWDRDELTTWLDAGDDDPAQLDWTEPAAAAGFTHVLVDEVMLENWADAERRWNDPRMTWAELSARAGDRLVPIATPRPGLTIFSLDAAGD